MKHQAKEESVAGLREGVSRGVSQACVYLIESHKSAAQVGMKVSLNGLPQLFRGMMESAITSGFVFGMYFATYHNVSAANQVWAGPVSTFATSLVKIPISNAMRLQQIGRARNVFGATKKIIRMQGVRGLYNGYALSIIEDVIEFDLRIRLYNSLKSHSPPSAPDSVCGIGFGAIAGMIASYVTSPIDTIRAHMTVNSRTAVQCIADIFNKGGVPAFYRGSHLRVLSNGTKYALFFLLYENLKFIG